MTRLPKILFATSLLLLMLSYPACQLGERKALSEMAKYPAEFAAAHMFDMIFVRWVLPGMWMFFGGSIMAVAAITVAIVQWKRRKSR